MAPSLASPVRWGDLTSLEDEDGAPALSYCEVLRSGSPSEGSSPPASPPPACADLAASSATSAAPSQPLPAVTLHRGSPRWWRGAACCRWSSWWMADRWPQAPPPPTPPRPASAVHAHQGRPALGPCRPLLQLPQRRAHRRHVHQRDGVPALPLAGPHRAGMPRPALSLSASCRDSPSQGAAWAARRVFSATLPCAVHALRPRRRLLPATGHTGSRSLGTCCALCHQGSLGAEPAGGGRRSAARHAGARSPGPCSAFHCQGALEDAGGGCRPWCG